MSCPELTCSVYVHKEFNTFGLEFIHVLLLCSVNKWLYLIVTLQICWLLLSKTN